MKKSNKTHLSVFLVTLAALCVLVACYAQNIVTNMNLGLDLRGGFEIAYEASPLNEGQDLPEMNVVVQSIQKRINVLGVSEPEIVVEGNNQIRVQLAGVSNQDEARKVISSTANLTFRDASNKLLMDASVLSEGGASLGYEDGSPVVSLKIADKDTFYKVTSELASSSSKMMVVWLDFEEGVDDYATEYAKVANGEEPAYISAATVSSGINGDAIIKGRFSEEEARTLANLINSGSLPVKLTEIYSNVVSAELGVSAYDMTMRAGAIGILLVMLFMIFVYRFPGVVAAIVLPVYVLVVLGLYNLMGGVFTLSGIAALVLGVGMTVDSNIITFERIKEELYLGHNVQNSISEGQKTSFWTIFDAQLTTFIATFVMYIFGTGSVKGFATMLMVTLVCTAFVSIMLVRFLLNAVSASGWLENKKTWFGVKMEDIPNISQGEKNSHVNPYEKIDFVKIAKYFVRLSCVVAVVAVVLAGARGVTKGEALNLGIDFSSGTKIQIASNDTLTVDSVTSTFESFGYTPSKIQLAGDNHTEATVIMKEAISQDAVETLKDNLYKVYQHEASDSVVTPIVGKQLVQDAFYLTILAWLAMLVYVSLRFKWDYAVGCIVALIHDVAMVFAVFVIFGYEINTDLIAVFLAIIGYSINNSIVVFDHIRSEVAANEKKKIDATALVQLVNRALADTFTRSIYSTITTLLPILCLLILGSRSIFTFNFAMLAGLVFGAYSSLFIAAQVWLHLRMHAKPKQKKAKKARKKEELEEFIVPGINDIR